MVVDCELQVSSWQIASGVRVAERCSTTVSQVAPPQVEALIAPPVKSGQVASHHTASGPPPVPQEVA